MARCQAGSSSLSRCQECHCLPRSAASCSASGPAGLCGLALFPPWTPCASTPRHLHSSTGPAHALRCVALYSLFLQVPDFREAV